jgi:hypothetical protein
MGTEAPATTHLGPWRDPAEESHLYPGLCLHDGRVSGSITVGCSRLPLWCFIGMPWEDVVDGWDYIEGPGYEWTEDKHTAFLHDLMEQRGEFGRLLLVLADAERCERVRGSWNKAWWETKKHRKRVREQLVRCIEALDEAAC